MGLRRKAVVVGLWLVCLSQLPGCLRNFHPVEPTPEAACPLPLPRPCQEHVHVFLITGLDPLDYANLQGLADYCQFLGFHNTYCGQMWHTAGFEDTIRTIYAQDHDARFVLIGFSLGANCIRALANHLHEDGDVPVDLMMYLGGNTLKDDAHSQPPNVKRFVNVLAWGFIWNGAEMGQADNVHVEDVWHFGSPTHPETLQRLSAALAEVGSAVHFIQPPPPPVLHPEPTPRPVAATARVAADEWDFLRPMGDLPQFTAPAGAPALVSFQ